MSLPKTPIRTCVSCRTSSGKRELLRVVRTPDGEVRFDPTGKMPGRGAYVCKAKECIAEAVKRNRLNRALRCRVPDGVLPELETIAVEDNAGK